MKSPLLIIATLTLMAIIACGIYQIHKVNRAHATFDNYYAFRGCTRLLDKTATDATCVTDSGQTIKIVLYENKWYLDRDLPCPGPFELKYLTCLI